MYDPHLRPLQSHFAWMLGQFLTWCFDNGYQVTIGEVYRTPSEAEANAVIGSGIARSLHTLSLAVDLRLFIAGDYQTDSAAYAPLGAEWKRMGGAWGGDFTKPDGNHFSLEYKGVR